MSKSSKVLFFLSMFLAISLSACHIVKRKARDSQLYVFSNREGCESVQSEAPCTLTWQLNPYVAKVYKQGNQMVATTSQLYRSIGINDLCTQAVENALCSQLVPRCSPTDGSRDYGDVSKLCQDIYSSCPQSVVYSLKQRSFCQTLKTGKHSNSACVAPSSPVIGICPQLKYKVPSEFLADYRKRSPGLTKMFDNLPNLRYDNGERIFSSECILLLKEISCSPIYCSADETKLLTKYDQGDCYKVIKECYEDLVSKLSQTSNLARSLGITLGKILQSSCDARPRSATAQLHEAPPALNQFPQQPDHPKRVTQQDHSNRVPQQPQQDRSNRVSQRLQQDHLNGVPTSAASSQFGHRMVLTAIITSVIATFYV